MSTETLDSAVAAWEKRKEASKEPFRRIEEAQRALRDLKGSKFSTSTLSDDATPSGDRSRIHDAKRQRDPSVSSEQHHGPFDTSDTSQPYADTSRKAALGDGMNIAGPARSGIHEADRCGVKRRRISPTAPSVGAEPLRDLQDWNDPSTNSDQATSQDISEDDTLFVKPRSETCVEKPLHNSGESRVEAEPEQGRAPTSNGTSSDDTTAIPEWYLNMKPNTISKANRSVVIQFSTLREAVKATGELRGGALAAKFDEIREQLHRYPFMIVDGPTIRKGRMLDSSTGLPRLFSSALTQVNGGVPFPFDIQADAEEIFNRWSRQDFLPDLLRGIDKRPRPGKAKNAETTQSKAGRILPNYPHKLDSKRYGHNGLVNGQWFPEYLCAFRDGAHGETQGGISGKKTDGAFSIVMSGGEQYEDIDNGDDIRYCGTKGTDGNPTEGTQYLLDSVNSQNPVRVLRTANMRADNPYRPEAGLRYDGLYRVVAFELLDPATATHRFRLVRCEGQPPSGVRDSARPEGPRSAKSQRSRRTRG